MRTDLDNGHGDRVAGPGQLLREAADVDPGRDLATASWEAAERRRHRAVWGVAAGLAAAAAAVAMVLVLGPWADGPPLTPVPAGPTGEDTFGRQLTYDHAMVFHRAGADDAEYTGRVGDPELADLADTEWTLVGHLDEGTVLPPAAAVGASAETVLRFSGADGTRLSISVENCGGVSGQSPLTSEWAGRFEIGDLATEDIGCPKDVQVAEDFWMESLAAGSVLMKLQEDGDVLVLMPLVIAPDPPRFTVSTEDGDGSAAEAPGTTPLGGGLAIDAPEGWQVVYRGSLQEGQFTSCLVPEGGLTDPTVPCGGVEVTTGLTGATLPAATEFFDWDSGPQRCFGDPAWRDREPGENPVTSFEEAAGSSAEWGTFTAESRRWSGRCAGGQSFEPEAWQVNSGDGPVALLTSAQGVPSSEGSDGMGALVTRIQADDSGPELVTQDASVDATEQDPARLGLSAFDPAAGPVGDQSSSELETVMYTVSDRTQCLLHDTSREPGMGLSMTTCAEFIGWVADNLEEEPLVTVVTRGDQLLHVRTLYLP